MDMPPKQLPKTKYLDVNRISRSRSKRKRTSLFQFINLVQDESKPRKNSIHKKEKEIKKIISKKKMIDPVQTILGINFSQQPRQATNANLIDLKPPQLKTFYKMAEKFGKVLFKGQTKDFAKRRLSFRHKIDFNASLMGKTKDRRVS